MTDIIEEQLSKSRTTYRNLHHPPSPTISPPLPKFAFENKIMHSDESDDDSTLPTFVNRFFFPKNIINNSSPPPPPPPPSNDTGMFRAIRGQVIIHHDYDRSSKVQHEEEEDDEEVEEELENLPINRPNVGNYELHYDVDNPLEISCSMSLSSAETISDHSPSPVRLTSSIHINGNNSAFKHHQTPVESSSSSSSSDEDDDDNTPSSILSDNDHHEEKKVIDHDNIKDQDEKLQTFRGWHLSMLKQIDEKLREIELETAATTTTTATITPVTQNKKTILKPLVNTNKKLLRPTIRRRFDTTNIKRHNSPVPQVKINNYRSRTPSVEKESRTLVINLPPSSSSSSSPSDDEQDFPPPPAPSEPINIRIVRSPINPTRQRSQSTDHLILRDQGAQTEPVDNRSIRPASAECERTQPTRSLTRTQGAQFLQQQQQQTRVPRPTEQIKFYSLRSRSAQPRPSIVNQTPMPMSQLPPKPSIQNRPSPTEQQVTPSSPKMPVPPLSADPSVYSADYGHCTQMDTSNLGTLVDRVFDDISQDKPSDFYRDYRQLLNDIQIRFSMISSVEQPPIIHPPPPPVHRQPPLPPPPPAFIDYSRVSQASSQARLCDTLIYIPNSH